MERSAIKRTILIVVLLGSVGVTVFSWLRFFRQQPPPVAVNAPSAVDVSLLVSIESLQTLQLDVSVLSDPRFSALEDFSLRQPAPVFEKGRTNPFVK